MFVRISTPTDVYCGVAKLSDWPFSDPLVVELEVDRGSFFITDVHIGANLPGLQRFLRKRLCGLPISEIQWLTNRSPRGTYHSDYWRPVQASLVFALKLFKEEHMSEFFASMTYVAHTRDGITPLVDSKSARSRRRLD